MSLLTGCGFAEKMPLTVSCQQGLPFSSAGVPSCRLKKKPGEQQKGNGGWGAEIEERNQPEGECITRESRSAVTEYPSSAASFFAPSP